MLSFNKILALVYKLHHKNLILREIENLVLIKTCTLKLPVTIYLLIRKC